MTVRLIVRRVRQSPCSQLALFTTWDDHAFVTNREGDALEIEADHRRHAIVEQRIAELKSAGMAQMRELHGQRRVARAERDAPQPRQSRRTLGQTRPGHRDRWHAATQGLHRPRRLGPQRTTTNKPSPTTTPSRGAAEPPLRSHNQDWEKPPHRRLPHAPTRYPDHPHAPPTPPTITQSDAGSGLRVGEGRPKRVAYAFHGRQAADLRRLGSQSATLS